MSAWGTLVGFLMIPLTGRAQVLTALQSLTCPPRRPVSMCPVLPFPSPCICPAWSALILLWQGGPQQVLSHIPCYYLCPHVLICNNACGSVIVYQSVGFPACTSMGLCACVCTRLCASGETIFLCTCLFFFSTV